jgi:tRNA (guanine-N7-)-methyltransferase
LELLFPSRSLSVARALFPLPWPKEARADKRLFSTGFLNLVADRLVDQGLFQLVTDDQTLAHWTLERAEPSDLLVTLVETQAGSNMAVDPP